MQEDATDTIWKLRSAMQDLIAASWDVLGYAQMGNRDTCNRRPEAIAAADRLREAAAKAEALCPHPDQRLPFEYQD